MTLLKIYDWNAVPLDSLTSSLTEEEKRCVIVSHYLNEGTLSPLTLYCYLKARFGIPNGLQMLFKNKESSDNLIHWHYTIRSGDEKLDVVGHTTRVEFYALSNHKYSKYEWKALLTVIKEDFKRCGKELSTVQKSLEHWSLFINPYRRLRYIVDGHIENLKRLELDKLQPVGAIQNGYDKEEFTKKLNLYISAHTKAASLSSMIRMSAPVLAESFVNLVIFLTVKPEVKSDSRIYNDFIQKHIDIRLKTLPLFCNGFKSKPDDSINQIKEFRRLMDRRNFILHGNFDPNALAVGDVWFDHLTPLFKEERMFYERVTEHSLTHIEPNEAFKDISIVDDFIEYILNLLDDESKLKVLSFKDHATPGWLKSKNRIGRLFPDHFSELLPTKD
ncbi:hypothetical protein [Janthinobacterium sp. 1_2014MBL_MicDiv]|uniref:hypothetical protein n=1 Tax=Janthinobacterium sp. 1_2014MBL_MicDiv TaxID=1644131 RepID=UPI0012EBBEDA|nr:hypothetical protein [Janthinobacterium sp. 1_2014MBL_MicDiv]